MCRSICDYRIRFVFIYCISILYARLNGSEQAEADLAVLWANCRAYDAKWANHFRYRTPLHGVCLPGKGGRGVVRLMYKLAHTVVRFN